jgi:hypothetical protein
VEELKSSRAAEEASSMPVECEGLKGDVLPGLIECLGRLAADSSASIFNRFEAINLLLRLAIGPRYRPADSVDIAASRHAGVALSDAAFFLDQMMTSKNYRARIRLHAASLASLVTKVCGRTAMPTA